MSLHTYIQSIGSSHSNDVIPETFETMLRTLSWGAWITGASVALSVLSGSAIWDLLGGANSLNVVGKPIVVRPDAGGLGKGWPAYGGDKGGNRYSDADQITPTNVQTLKLAWTLRTGALEGKVGAAQRSAFEATPILVHDKLVFCTPLSEIIAAHPGTGKILWRFDPKIALDRKPGNQYTCRGVAFWQDTGNASGPCSSRIFAGTVDSRILAVDADTGKACEDFGRGGEVQLESSRPLKWPGEMQITSAPAIVGDTLVTGTSIADNLRSAAPLGTVWAFDVRSGAQRWRFDPVSPEAAACTGAANVWSTISVDEARQLVFLPTSAPSPDHWGAQRAENLPYANAVVALHAATGKVAWSFQTVHHDLWDYDVAAQPGLYTVSKGGAQQDVVAQVTKSGLVFVLDRETGLPVLPIAERPAPQAGIKGEFLSPTQPMPVATPPVVPSMVRPQDAFGVTGWDRLACARDISKLRANGLYTPPSESGTLVYPFIGGGANWGSTAFDPRRNLMIVNMTNIGSQLKLVRKSVVDGNVSEAAKVSNVVDGMDSAPMDDAPFKLEFHVLLSPFGLPCTPPPWGVLAAVDLLTGKIVWRRAHGTTEDMAPFGAPLPLGTPTIGGPIVTASGLVFIGASMDDYLRAYEIDSGKELWKGRLPAGGQATPMSYTFEGRQYVVIAAGGHSLSGTRLGDYMVAYALPKH